MASDKKYPTSHGALTEPKIPPAIDPMLVSSLVGLIADPRHHYSINIFFTPPTSHKPRWRIDSLSLAYTILAPGTIGLFGSTWEASLAACSIASISSLHACWSIGHMTMGCRKVISRAEVMCAYEIVSQHPTPGDCGYIP